MYMLYLFILFCNNLLSEKIIYYISPWNHNIGSARYISADDFLNPLSKCSPYAGFSYSLNQLKNKLKKINCEFKVVSPQNNYHESIMVFDHDAVHPANNDCPVFKDYLQYIPKHQRVLVLGEPPFIKPENYNGMDLEKNILPNLFNSFSKILTMVDEPYKIGLKNNLQNVNKIYYPQPILKMIDLVKFNEKKLCIMVGGDKFFSFPYQEFNPNNGYAKRRDFVKFMSCNNYNLDLYGGYTWTTWSENKSIYKGVVPYIDNLTFDSNIPRQITDKINLIKNYKFYLCYENEINRLGWITEKIFESFVAGCVPIYWGAQNIHCYVPENCFINRNNFSSDAELYKFISHLSEDDYNLYINNIKNYLQSDDVSLFSVTYFIYKWLSLIFDESLVMSLFDADEKIVIKNALRKQLLINNYLLQN
jgi:hypothetical protein